MQGIYARLAEKLGVSKRNTLREKLCELVTRPAAKSKKPKPSSPQKRIDPPGNESIVILVDEVDQLSESALSELYALPAVPNSCATVIGKLVQLFFTF